MKALLKDFRHRVYEADLNSIGPAILSQLKRLDGGDVLYFGDDFDYSAVSYHDETQISPTIAANLVHALDAEINNAVFHARNYGHDSRLDRFAKLLHAEDKRLYYLWVYGAGESTYTATQRDTLNRLGNKVRAESV